MDEMREAARILVIGSPRSWTGSCKFRLPRQNGAQREGQELSRLRLRSNRLLKSQLTLSSVARPRKGRVKTKEPKLPRNHLRGRTLSSCRRLSPQESLG